jgi:hypothetical protein
MTCQQARIVTTPSPRNRNASSPTSVRGLGECGGHVWAPALNRGADPPVRPQPNVRGLGECGGHVWAPALNRA